MGALFTHSASANASLSSSPSLPLSHSASLPLLTEMRLPFFVSKLLKRKKAKSEQAPIDEYERAIVESPPTPPETSGEEPVTNPLSKYDRSWRFVDRPRATAHLMTDVSWDSNRAQHGGNGSSREINLSSGDVAPHEWPLQKDDPRHHNAPNSRTSPPPALAIALPVAPSPVQRRGKYAKGRVRAPSQSDSNGLRIHVGDPGGDPNHRSLPLLPPPHRHAITSVDYGSQSNTSKQSEPLLLPNAKSQSSFDIPLSWESLEELETLSSSQDDGVNDLAIARRVERMASLDPPVTSINREPPPSRTASEAEEPPLDLALDKESPDTNFLALEPVALSDEDTIFPMNEAEGYLAPAQEYSDRHESGDCPSPLLTPVGDSVFALKNQTPSRAPTDSSIRLVTPSSSCPSSISPSTRFPLTPPNSRPSSGIHSPVMPLHLCPPSPRTPFGSPLTRSLPLTPAGDAKIPPTAIVDGLSPNAIQTEAGARVDPSAYPTPNSSLGKK